MKGEKMRKEILPSAERVRMQGNNPDIVISEEEGLDAFLKGAAKEERPRDLSKRTLKSLELVALRVIFDIAAFLGAARFAYWMRFEFTFMTSRFPPAKIPEFHQLIYPLLCGLPILLLFMKIVGLYQTHVRIRILDRLPRVIAAVNAFIVSFLVVMFLLKAEDPARGYLIFLWFFSILFIFAGRVVLQFAYSIAGADDVVKRRTLIVGAGKVGKALALKMVRHPEFGLCPVGFIDNDPLYTQFEEPEIKHLRVLGGTGDLRRIVKEYGVEKVVIGFSREKDEDMLNVVSECSDAEVECSILPRLYEVITDEIMIREVGGISLVPLRRKRLSGFDLVLKTVEDYVLGIIALLIFWPLLIATAIAIKIDSPGPVFFTQTRVGKGGKPFKFIKFRSMVKDAESMRPMLKSEKKHDDILWKVYDDPRVTRVGRWIRKFSIDEAPQIFNVLAGQMSLVGPRPGLPEEVEKYKEWHKLRLNVKPGITGLWQVSGRSDLPFDEMVKYDLYYIERWSLWLDIKTIIRTITAVFSRRGAY